MINVDLSIPLENGWKITKVTFLNSHATLGQVSFRQHHIEFTSARIDMGKMMLLDPLPEGLQVPKEILMDKVLPPLNKALQAALVEEWNSVGTEK